LCSQISFGLKYYGVLKYYYIVLKSRKKKGKKCPHAGSNYGPSVYKTDALPLSYRGCFDLCQTIMYLNDSKDRNVSHQLFAADRCSNNHQSSWGSEVAKFIMLVLFVWWWVLLSRIPNALIKKKRLVFRVCLSCHVATPWAASVLCSRRRRVWAPGQVLCLYCQLCLWLVQINVHLERLQF
jgi:hypothetical protein